MSSACARPGARRIASAPSWFRPSGLGTGASVERPRHCAADRPPGATCRRCVDQQHDRPVAAANSRWQLSRILSNTGCGVGHRAADDLQHFGGGGLLLQRLLRLVEQPRVLDRDHRLVGEGAQQRDLVLGERPRRLAHHHDRADAAVFPQHRREHAREIADRVPWRDATSAGSRHRAAASGMWIDAAARARPGRCRSRSSGLGRVAVIGLNRPRRAARPRAPARRRAPERWRAGRSRTAARSSARILSNTGARVGHRTADDLQHLGRGRLLLQRLLRLVEQPHVLDRDHGLVGEGLQQRDLLGGEGAGSLRADADHADACRPAAAAPISDERKPTSPSRAARRAAAVERRSSRECDSACLRRRSLRRRVGRSAAASMARSRDPSRRWPSTRR